MRQKTSSFSIITIFICLALIGVSLIPLLNVQLKPSPSSSSIHVSFSWPDASAKVIEQEVTSKLEGVFNRIKEVGEISSMSSKGSGSISVQFKKNVNMDAVRFEMANLIRQSYHELPLGVSYPRLSRSISSESNSPILSYSINSNESPYFIKKYADNHIVPKLSMINGISRVNVYGAAPYEWVITYDADKLFQLQLSANEVAEAINTFLGENELGKGNLITLHTDTPNEISVSLLYKTSDKLNWGNIPIKKVGDRLIYLEDIASVRFQEGPVYAYYRINGLNTLNIVLYPEKGVNRIALSKKLKNIVDTIEKDISSQYQLELTNDPTAYLIKELQKIKRRSLFSLLILLVLTILVYRNIKYVLILFLSIAINLLLAVIFYYFFEVDLQLYSFAGITISFGIIIDNTIIMMDHIRHKGNKKAFLAILAATLTTIGAVTVIFMLEKSQRANLSDFALVLAINLGVSLLVAYYLVPALLDKFQLQKNRGKKFSRKRKRRILNVTGYYSKAIIFSKRPVVKVCLILIVVLGFGIPLHLAPEKIEQKGFWAEAYNKSIGNVWFSLEIRPRLEKVIGGTFRLFTENVFESSHYQEPERTSLRVRGSMPDGSTIEQLNEVIEKMEHYIASFEEVELFETRINSYKNSNISIYFKEEYEHGGFPYILKSLIETKAISLGGLDWYISGVGKGFSNALGSNFKSDRIALQGYNYDKLYGYAEMLKEELLEKSNERVKDVEINSGEGWNSSVLYEYYLQFDPKLMAMSQVDQSGFYNVLKNQLHSGLLRPIVNNNELQQVKLTSEDYKKTNVWDLKNAPLTIGQKQYKLGQLATITKKKTGNEIKKINQQYHLTVAFNFIGPRPLAEKFKENQVEAFSGILPIGYKVFKPAYSVWNKNSKEQYYYILVVVVIIFFICAILLESLLQPLAVISMIPISFIGLFLTFYLFEFNFDQGGYAAFILLSGISVNAALYIVNDFNNLKKEHPKGNSQELYLKAYNHKIVPILLTIISTIAGLLPFVWGGQQEVFWFSFAIGSIGGLLFSLIGIVFFLPLLCIRKQPVILRGKKS